MAKAKTIKGGKFRVLLGNDETPTVYSAPCGFTQRSMSLNKSLEEIQIPDCDDPDKVDWTGRDASSLSMTISGEGVLAVDSLKTWLAAWKSVDSIPVKIELELPTETVTWTGFMQVENVEIAAQNSQTVTLNVSMQSDGEMVETVAP
ncbi:phage tail tube protein [Paenochrobactrum pullorum]|uniref:phage tail tube protein n=1 Tax=Paenochrobactrum pullorum TaxID=1324351 RepID=UPI0035BBD32C